MRNIMLLVFGLLFVTPVMSDETSVSSSNDGRSSWVVLGDKIYFCHIVSYKQVFCTEAKKRVSD